MKIDLAKIEQLAQNCASKLKMEIISVEYVREFGINILRVIARKEPIFTIDDSAELNQLISEELDKYDLIAEEYYLEVSSEGVERELRSDLEIKEALGEYVCIRLYEKLDGKKEIYGDLVSFDDDKLVLNTLDKNIEKQMVIEKDKLAKIRLAVKF